MGLQLPSAGHPPRLRAPAPTGPARLDRTWLRAAALASLFTLPVPGCGDPIGPSVDAEPTWQVQEPLVVGGTLTVQLTAHNPRAEAIRFELAALCTPTLRLYRASSTPAWDQLTWWQARPGGCKGVDRTIVLQPGQSREMSGSAEVATVLGDSLPPGPYQVGVVVWQRAPTPRFLELPAGSIDLNR